MKQITSEWVAKAEGDYTSARREIAAPVSPNFDVVAFLAQQCAEKYLKAVLVEAGIAFPKTHDLEAILNLVLPLQPGWAPLRPDLQSLTSLGIEVRYPGVCASASDAAKALATAETVRNLVRPVLGLPT